MELAIWLVTGERHYAHCTAQQVETELASLRTKGFLRRNRPGSAQTWHPPHTIAKVDITEIEPS
jgi:hypothetical protein